MGSAPISAVAIFIALLLGLGFLATLAPSVSQLFSGVREGLREGGERGAELVRIYIHSDDGTELGAPVITVVSAHDADSWLTDYVVVARDGSVIAAGKVGGALGGLRLPPGGRVDLDPRSLGLGYATFAELADNVKAIYFRTSEGNSFGSSYGPPPPEHLRVDRSYTTSEEAEIVLATYSTSYSYSFPTNLTLPRPGDAFVVKNVLLVDPRGFVRGGATNGQRWSDGSFDPSRIPLPTRPGAEVVPIGGYYRVPDWGNNGGECFYLYDRNQYDACPQFIELVEFYPVELFEPGGSAEATAYYMRFAGEAQVVTNQVENLLTTVTVQRPVRPIIYPYTVPGTYTATIPATYTSYKATASRTREPTRTQSITITSLILSPTATRTITSWTRSCTTMTHVVCNNIRTTYTTTLYTTRTHIIYSRTTYYTTYSTIVRIGTSTYTTIVTTPVAVWPEGGLVKAAPIFDPYPALDHKSDTCGVRWGSSGGGRKTCSFTIHPPPGFGIAIREIGFFVERSSNNCGVPRVIHVKVTGPWGTYIIRGADSWTMTNLPYGSVSFELEASHVACSSGNSRARLYAWVVYEIFWTERTATATVGADVRSWVRQALRGTSLSGDAAVDLRGTVSPGQVIKVNAPIIVLNYVYFVRTDPTPPPPPPPSTGGGGRGGVGPRMRCERVEELRPAEGAGGGGGSYIAPGVAVREEVWVWWSYVRCVPL